MPRVCHCQQPNSQFLPALVSALTASPAVEHARQFGEESVGEVVGAEHRTQESPEMHECFIVELPDFVTVHSAPPPQIWHLKPARSETCLLSLSHRRRGTLLGKLLP
jgi:hypothetical protein